MAIYIKLEKIEETTNFVKYKTEGGLTSVFRLDKITGEVWDLNDNIQAENFTNPYHQCVYVKLHQFFLTSSYPEVGCWAS